MKRWTLTRLAAATTTLILCASIAKADGPTITMPTLAEATAQFVSPPNQYGIGLWWGWGGPMDDASIARDLDTIKKMGFTVACVEADNGITSKYLSPDWFHLVKTAVAEAKKRDMYLWFEDEAKYPSGFAGGLFTEKRPDLCMQVLAPAEPISVVGGQTVVRDLPPNTVAAMAVNQQDGTSQVLDVASEKLNWNAPPGNWDIQTVRHEFRTSPTRSVNNPNFGAKDGSESLEDYLNPDATRQFVTWTHEQYKAAVGDELGKTVLGFTGDEPDFTIGNALPWTNALFDEFQKVKGYDIRPYLGAFFSRQMTDKQRRAYVDYFDIWSEMFGHNFFGVQGDWCAANNCMYQLHVNHEDMLMALVRSEGDFFRCMRSVEMPGIDLIYAQVWPGKPTDNPPGDAADFPKLASSVADVYGRPRSYTESFAAMTVPPSVAQAKWCLDEQFARGVNMVEIMWWTSPTTRLGRGGGRGGFGGGSGFAAGPGGATRPTTSPTGRRGRGGFGGPRGPSFFTTPQFPAVAQYLHRASYLLSIGKPTAKIGLYVPFTSMWFGDRDSYGSCLSISTQLMHAQRGFDFLNEEALTTALTLDGGKLTNLSGESYETIIIPSVTVLSKAAIDRLREFSAAGGKVIFMGRLPTMMVDKTYLDAPPPPDLSWAVREPSGKFTPAVLAALPEADVKLGQPCPSVVCNHRRIGDADIYFFFNESTDEPRDFPVALEGSGAAQLFDADNGTTEPIAVAATEGTVTVHLSLGPSQSKFVIVGK